MYYHFLVNFFIFLSLSGVVWMVLYFNKIHSRYRKGQQETLKVANDRFYKAFQLGPHMMTIIRKSDNRYVDVNRRFLEENGLDREEVIGNTPTEMGVIENQFKQIIEILDTQGTVQNYESSLIMKDGSKRSLIVSAEKIQIDDQAFYLRVMTLLK